MIGHHCRSVNSLLAVLLLLAAGPLWAAEPLPEPLTLSAALNALDETHPQLLRAAARRDSAAAQLLATESQRGTTLSLEGRARWIEPSELASDPSHNDSSAHLYLRKPLYDFGRSRHGEAAGRAQIEAREFELHQARFQQRIDTLSRYFDVLLADLESARDDEAMAIAFVTLDKARDRSELGQLSDVELLKTESRYQHARQQQALSSAKQRATRALLAEVLNRPGELPSTVVEPPLPDSRRPLPEFELLSDRATEQNPELLARRAELEMARRQLQRARAEGSPSINGEMEGSLYNRDGGSRDPWRAGVVLEVPLYSGGRVDAAVAKAQAELRHQQADYAIEQRRVGQQVLELWQEIGLLQLRREEAAAQIDYRDLYLDRSRALYELEVKTDLGDAMVQFSAARLQRAEVDYALALAWARLDALLGEMPGMRWLAVDGASDSSRGMR